MSGSVVDLLLRTGALDTSPAEGRDRFQKRVNRMLHFHSKPFRWAGHREHKLFTLKRAPPPMKG